MTKLIALVLALSPAIALADKDFNDGAGGTYNCDSDSVVNINSDGGRYTLTGSCSQVNVNGSGVSLTIASATQLAINGSRNSARVASVGTILIQGDKNSVVWAKSQDGGIPTIAAVGSGNSVSKAR